jgi:hypothetical protein
LLKGGVNETPAGCHNDLFVMGKVPFEPDESLGEDSVEFPQAHLSILLPQTGLFLNRLYE